MVVVVSSLLDAVVVGTGEGVTETRLVLFTSISGLGSFEETTGVVVVVDVVVSGLGVGGCVWGRCGDL